MFKWLMAFIATLATALAVIKFAHELATTGQMTPFDTDLALWLAITALMIIARIKSTKDKE